DVTALNLAGGRARDRLDDINNLGAFELRERQPAMSYQLGFGSRAAENYRGCHLFAVDPVRDPEAYRFGDRRMTQQRFIDLARRNLLAAAIDQLLDSANQSQIAFVIQVALIACAKPAIRERCGISLRVAFVPAEDVRPFDRHLPCRARRKQIASLVESRDAHG